MESKECVRIIASSVAYLVGKEMNQFQEVGKRKENQPREKGARVTQHSREQPKILTSPVVPFLQCASGPVSQASSLPTL